ncbi:MAG: AraC family transcriptional regulator [Treponema sp.]|jgi:AraC-like DNA-binding protein|nr:AraC family transcriptional regulator [Treponema sp.]
MEKLISEDFFPKIDYHVFRKCNLSWRLQKQRVNRHDITYIVKGKARYTINDTAHELGPGDLVYLTEKDYKEAITYPDNLMQCFSINFTFDKTGGAIESLLPAINHIGLRRDIVNLFRELTISWAEQQSGYMVKTRALLMLIIQRLMEIIVNDIDSEPGDYRINKITRYISLHYPEKLTVKNLALQIGIDTDYFGHLFKRETGMTVHQYITKIRIRSAENMLQSGNYKVQEVAEQCGFSDNFHFYKSFRSLRGFAPSNCIPKKNLK